MHPVLRESVQPQQPVAADGLSIEPDVVVEDHAVALADAPADAGPQRSARPSGSAIRAPRPRSRGPCREGRSRDAGRRTRRPGCGAGCRRAGWARRGRAGGLGRRGARRASPCRSAGPDRRSCRAGSPWPPMLAAGRRAGYARAMTQPWRTLVLLYPVLDARYGSGLQRATARRVMTRDERAAVMDVVERLPATVRAWSDDLATLEPFDVVEVRRSVRSLSSSGARPVVGRPPGGPARARSCRGHGRHLRFRLRAVAVRSVRAAMRLGVQHRAVGRDVRGRVLVDLHRPLADAPHGPRPRAGLRPRVAAPGRVRVPGARRLGGRAPTAPRRGGIHLGPAGGRATIWPDLCRVPRWWRQDVGALVPRLDDGSPGTGRGGHGARKADGRLTDRAHARPMGPRGLGASRHRVPGLQP